MEYDNIEKDCICFWGIEILKDCIRPLIRGSILSLFQYEMSLNGGRVSNMK